MADAGAPAGIADTWCRTAGRVGVLVALVLPASVVRAGPITFPAALAVTEGEAILRVQGQLIRSTDDPGSTDRELTVRAFPTVLVYGASQRFTLFGVFPYLDQQLELTTAEGRRTRGDSGIGDVRVLVRYKAGQWDERGETKRLAPIVGLGIPTGRDDEKDAMGRLPRTLQLGSGSWDPSLGLVFTWQTLGWELDASVSHEFNTEADDFEFGDESRVDVSYQHRLWPRQPGEGVPGFLYGVIESNLIRQDRNELRGVKDRNSGGTTWYLVPGIQYVTRRLVVEAAVQLPIVQDLNGDALENDFRATAGMRVNF